MKITRIEVKDFRGIEHQAFDVGEAGALICGKSKSGKTSLLDAISAALGGVGVSPDAIRNGADRAEILIELDHASVKRIIRASGKNQLTTDGLGIGKPQGRLDELFGPMLDPLELSRLKGPDRQKRVLSVMPALVTTEDLQRWTGEKWTPTEGMHGLEVIADVRKHYYDARAAANRDVKQAEAAAHAASQNAITLTWTGYEGVPICPDGAEDGVVRVAEDRAKQLKHRQTEAEAQRARTEGTRTKIAALRAAASKRRADAPIDVPQETIRLAELKHTAAYAEVKRLRDELEQAERDADVAAEERKAISDIIQSRKDAFADANGFDIQADNFEDTLAATSIAAPTAEELADVDTELEEARAQARIVKAARAAHEAVARSDEMADKVIAAKTEANRLDAIVSRLTVDAPAELAAQSHMIPGLTFVEGDIALDGKPFSLLSGTEMIELCTEIAKRAAPKGKLLRVNGLEQIDPDTLEAFIKMATADGWQLIGTRVERGELRIVALEPDDAK